MSLHTASQPPRGTAQTPVLPSPSQDCLSCLEKPVLPQHLAEPRDSCLTGFVDRWHAQQKVRAELNEGSIRKNVFREAGRKLFFTGFPSVSSSAFILEVAR